MMGCFNMHQTIQDARLRIKLRQGSSGWTEANPVRGEERAVRRVFQTMRASSYAFTIIELMIALFLSSFIMLGMIQAYRNAVSSLGVCRESMAITRKVCLLFNELERDFSCLFIPYLNQEVIPEKDQAEKKAEKKDQAPEQKTEQTQDVGKKEDEKKSAHKKEEPLKYALLAHVYEDETKRIQGRRFELFRSINFITTHPLQVYGDKRIRLVRVMYELVRDKKKSKPDKPCYNLFRKETLDLQNFKMKEEEGAGASSQSAIRTYLVSDNVKEMYVELIAQKPIDEKEKEKQEEQKKKKDEVEEVRFFSWGEKDFTVGTAPQALEIQIILWDDALKRTQKFQIFVPVFSYPAVQSQVELEAVKPLERDQKQDEQKKVSGMVVTGVDQTSPTTFQSAGATP